MAIAPSSNRPARNGLPRPRRTLVGGEPVDTTPTRLADVTCLSCFTKTAGEAAARSYSAEGSTLTGYVTGLIDNKAALLQQFEAGRQIGAIVVALADIDTVIGNFERARSIMQDFENEYPVVVEDTEVDTEVDDDTTDSYALAEDDIVKDSVVRGAVAGAEGGVLG